MQRIFELKIMVINGEYTEQPQTEVSDSARYAWEYVVLSPIEKLYTFILTEEVFEEFRRSLERNKKTYIDRTFHSLEILKVLLQQDS